MEEKMRKCKTLLIIVVLFTVVTSFAYSYNYGEVLQKAIYFYECQQAGPLPAWNRVEWRGDATMSDAVTGGWYDAGDHVKFNLPMSYTATMLGWALYEYGGGFSSIGEKTNMDNNLKFVLQYLMDCWSGSTYTYQIGDGGADHVWWGPVEMIHLESPAGDRPSFSAGSGLSAVMAESAAALALGYILYGNSSYLSEAESLYSRAASGNSDANYTAANGFYNSWSGPTDELLFSAMWLYEATGKSSYLSDANTYHSRLSRDDDTGEIGYGWGHCWDDVRPGALLLHARATNNQESVQFMENHLDFWANGAKGFTPGGLSWLDTWGSLRYATTAAFIAFVWSDHTGSTSYLNWAISQVDYCLGDNERNGSYVVGYGSNAPEHPHHRTSHGSWSDQQSVPANHRHTLYGALVGGPNSGGGYTDSINDFQSNEVACDYNAGFIGALARMVSVNGGSTVSGFPPAETKDDEFFVEASINSTGNTYTEIKALCNNRSGWPARVVENLRFRYFFDISEVTAAGYGVNDLKITTNHVEFDVNITGPTQLSGNVYYVEIAFLDGTDIYPGGQSEYAGEVQFRIACPDGTNFWDPTNDFSYTGLAPGTAVKTDYIPVYDGSTLLYGLMPGVDPTSAPTPTPTTAPTGTLGDVDGNGSINIVDALLIAQYYVDLNPSPFDASQADTDCDMDVDIIDALLVAQYYVDLINEFC